MRGLRKICLHRFFGGDSIKAIINIFLQNLKIKLNNGQNPTHHLKEGPTKKYVLDNELNKSLIFVSNEKNVP